MLAALLAACSAPEPALDLPDDRVWESTHFRYHTRSGDDSACEEVLAELERHFGMMQAYLGFPWSDARKVDYYKFLDQADFLKNSGCPADAGSCARDTAVLSARVLQPHELIHTYLAPLGLPPAFFVEGIASVLDCDHPWAVAPRPAEDVVALPFGTMRAYLEGAWFSGYLLDTYGPEPFLSLYGALNHTAPFSEIAAAFESSYGESLTSAWASAEASGRRVRCVNSWACSAPAIPLDGTPHTLARACDGRDLFGTFELDAAGDLILSPRGSYVYAPSSCDEALPYAVGGDAAPEDDVVTFTAVTSVAKGRYFMAPWEESAEVRLRASPATAFALDCAEAQAIALKDEDFAESRFELSIPNEGSSWFVKVRPDGVRSVLGTSSGTVRVERCSSCEALSCELLDGIAAPDEDGDVLLRLTPLHAGPGYATATLGYE